jgi:hypothetical protein
MRVGKLLCEFSIRELHNSIVGSVEEGGLEDARNSEGKVVISDTALRRIIKKGSTSTRTLN